MGNILKGIKETRCFLHGNSNYSITAASNTISYTFSPSSLF